MEKLKTFFTKDIVTSFFGIIVLIHMVYPNANGTQVVNAFKDGTWIAAAINIAFAYSLIRSKKEMPK